MSQPTTNGITNGDLAPETNNNIPAWLTNATINKAVQAELGDFDKVLSVEPVANFKVGENFSSTMLRLNVEVKMLDGAVKSPTFVLKTQLTSGPMAQISEMLKLFDKEETIYHSILPKFEKLYRDVGKEVKFAPAAYKFDRDLGVDYVLMQDLRGYKNANRCVGLDMVQMKEALKKLAEWHAASACYVEHYGMFGEEFTVGVFSEKNRDFLTAIDKSDAFLAQLKRWKNCQAYYEKLEDSDLYLVDRLLQDQKVNSREFNVLNHGDCWVNNIMFQYDAFGKIKDTLFVDFQVVKYGTPAFDLYYLILTSAQKDIKIKEFDYLIRFYYDNLVENLKLLQYHRPLPKLKNIHIQLMNFGLGAYMVVSKVLPVVMLEKTDAVMDDEVKMKAAMLTNRKYVEAMAEILPWLDNRGLLDWKQA